MIYYDITKMGTAKHRSGLMRVSSRLQQKLGSLVTSVTWDGAKRGFVTGKARAEVKFAASDWLFTVELFSEAERPGFTEFIQSRRCRLAAMFHDAIPIRWPHITWPQSVQRHPGYMKLLASFDRVFAISEASRRDLIEFWRWQGVQPRAEVGLIELGADFDSGDRAIRDARIARSRAQLLCVGIIEPRKNQMFLLDVAEALWSEGVDFDLHIVGRVNPHFGKPILKRMQSLKKTQPRFKLHEAVSDDELGRLYSKVRAVVFPTIAEGCGLPLLESLWRGVPCVCSDLPVLRENADAGGCVVAKLNDLADWKEKLRAVLTDADFNVRLQAGAMARPLTRWGQTAQVILKTLK
ncbi:glycosyltransferase [Oleiharenicola lentus]|uniref:glycosyltransferase n=1 Tax=Oleiharenicola lentus TaxID=2508720 RepID=UPI003F665AEE